MGISSRRTHHRVMLPEYSGSRSTRIDGEPSGAASRILVCILHLEGNAFAKEQSCPQPPDLESLRFPRFMVLTNMSEAVIVAGSSIIGRLPFSLLSYCI
ncbi:hypothetical protein SAY86_027194 [Trapa natans]|uniref:Uncharacterized protein n=1 Tax=Trapa natans TaxID=22666 RepID=A0AAN7KKC1_TRANT|nr:hypothetical protein SAY86_027194 [Trapa natans]